MSNSNLDDHKDGKPNPGSRAISTLERREIQAPLMVRMIEGFINELGYEKAMQVVSDSIRQDATETGIRMAEEFGGNSTKELLEVLRQVWAERDALVYDVLEQTEQRLSFNVTRCRFAEMYERLGVKQYGDCLSCSRDEALINAFNPRMKLIRTQTIMQGAKLCDFRIVVEEE